MKSNLYEVFIDEFHRLEVNADEFREEHEVDVLLRVVEPAAAPQQVEQSLLIFGGYGELKLL